jgi:replicative DNA helicase Mcm
MATSKDGIQERFEEFLRTYKNEHGNLIYWRQIQQMSINDETSLSIDFEDLSTFDNVFMVEAAENPTSFLETANNGLISVLRVEDPDYVQRLPEGTIRARIVNYPEHVALRALRSKHIGRLIQISGLMMRASEVKPLLVDAVFKCRLCDEEIPQPQEDGRYTEPPICPVCGKKTSMRLLPKKSRFMDWQKVRIQESPEELPPGQMPRSVDVVLEGDIVDLSRPGDLVRITGILQTSPDFSRRRGRLATFNVNIDAVGIEIAEKEYEQVDITEEDEKRIRELAEDPYVHERIYASIAPSIHGHERIKESIALLLFGGVGKTLPDGTRLRGKSNILMIGDPGTGKSQILKFVSSLASRSLYTSGKGTSAAGLTAAVVHDTDTGAMTLEAGALVLADQGIACIDEFDKMDPNDRTAIHEAMEQHSYHPSTEITLANGNTINIGEFVDTVFEKNDEEVVDGINCEILPLSENIPVLSTDFNGLMPINIDRLSRHEAPDYFYKIRFSNGRSVIVTPEHPMYIYDFGITTIDASKLNVGDFVPAPRKTSYESPESYLNVEFDSGHKAVHLPETITIPLAYFLGYLAAEGYSYDGQTAEVGLSNSEPTIISHMIEVIESAFHIEPLDYSDENRTIRILSRTLFDYLKSNFHSLMKKSYEKRIPRSIFSCTKEIRIAFLNAAFSGDGSVETETCSYSTNSRGLAHDYQDLLLTLGIHTRIHKEEYEYSNGQKSRYRYKVYIRGDSLERFASVIIPEDINDKLVKYRPKLNKLILRSKRTNRKRDNLPGQVAHIIKDCLKALGVDYDGYLYQHIEYDYSINLEVVKSYLAAVKEKYEMLLGLRVDSDVRKLREASGYSQSQIAEIAGTTRGTIDYYERGGYSHTKRQQVLSELEHGHTSHLNEIKEKIDYLEKLSSFRWLRIKSIEKIPNSGKYRTDWVYDITVEPTRSFVSQGVILHNTVSIAKAGIVATLNARTSILAAANPSLGRYEPQRSVQDNIKLPFTILSRFDLLWILIDRVEAEKDRELAQFILGMHQLKQTKSQEGVPPIDPEFLRKYIGYANRYVIPRLTAEAAEVIEDFYVGLRKSAEGGGAPVPITARQLESLVRLAEARARMGLRSEVTKEDAQAAVRLMEESLRMVALDGTGRIDIDKLVSTMSAAQRSSSDKILDAMKELESDDSSTVSEEALLQRVSEMGVSRERAVEVIEKLLAEGLIYSPSEGKIERIKG